jgi:hypothetical protein
MEILKKRGHRNDGRTLNDIYDDMDRVWVTILKIPMLTKYTSRKIKEFEASLTQWKYDQSREMEALIERFKLNIPEQLAELDVWER